MDALAKKCDACELPFIGDQQFCIDCSSLMSRPKKQKQKKPREAWRYTHGLSDQQYEQMLIQQNGCCAICKEKPKKKRLAVDHCHDTGKVRGLLCVRCNVGLGSFRDNALIMQSAMNYIQKDHSEMPQYKAHKSNKEN